MERTTSSGLILEERTVSRDTPNGNPPESVPPATVGPETYVPGDPHGVEILAAEPGVGGSGPSAPSPQPWSGWPSDWQVPNWYGRVETFTDTAWACLDLNSSILASMPPYLVGAAPLASSWLENPDPDLYESWDEFMKALVWDYQMGEAFILTTAVYEETLYPARFHVVPPWLVDAEIDGNGRRRYAIGGHDVTPDILHLRYKSTISDARGHGPLEAGALRVIAANALARYATRLASSGAVPPAALLHPASLNKTQAEDLQTAWVTARMSTMGLPAVLSGGLDFKTLAFSPREMALLDLSQFNESRIATLLQVPPFLVGLPTGGDSMTYSNVTSLFDYHWRAGLRPKASALCAALSGWLLPPGTRLELNRDEYVKPGPLERAQVWQILVSIGVLTPEQVGEIERTANALPTETLTSGVLQ